MQVRHRPQPLRVVEHMTQRARSAIAEADVVIGYVTYIKLVADLIEGKEIIRKSMTEELDRAVSALEAARAGEAERAGQLVKVAAQALGGGGGGKDDVAQGGGIDVTKVNPGPYNTGFNDRMVNAIPTYIDEGDTSATETHAALAPIVLDDQLDPNEVALALADLTEADETPEETFLPAGIVEALAARL